MLTVLRNAKPRKNPARANINFHLVLCEGVTLERSSAGASTSEITACRRTVVTMMAIASSGPLSSDQHWHTVVTSPSSCAGIGDHDNLPGSTPERLWTLANRFDGIAFVGRKA